MIILILLAFASGLVTSLLYHRVAAQDWQREVDECDRAIGFWMQAALGLERRNRELEGEQPRVGIDRDVGFVWWER